MTFLTILYTGLDGLIGNDFASRMLSLPKDKINHYSMVRSLTPPLHDLISSRVLPSQLIQGDCSNKTDFVRAIRISKPDLIVHISQMRYTKFLIEALDSLEYDPKLIIVGTTGVFSRFKGCHYDYKDSENRLLGTNRKFFVIRPTMIYGSPLDKNLHNLFLAIKRNSFIFLPGNGLSIFQPVYYKDIGYALFTLINIFIKGNQEFNQTFLNLPGPDIVNLLDIVNMMEHLNNKSVVKLRLPLSIVYYFINVFVKLGFANKLKLEQILRLSENKYYTNDWDLLDPTFTPTSFANGLSLLKSEMLSATNYE